MIWDGNQIAWINFNNDFVSYPIIMAPGEDGYYFNYVQRSFRLKAKVRSLPIKRLSSIKVSAF